jgi:hypothetical protein
MQGAIRPRSLPALQQAVLLYDRKNAECKRQATAKKFGIHFIQRNRWIKECIARG